ncbi:MAG TPA: CRTAC1 family protein [Gemmataceae bacterium]|nr:CRTAC1 family protein [Gemmataceae bacterium]
METNGEAGKRIDAIAHLSGRALQRSFTLSPCHLVTLSRCVLLLILGAAGCSPAPKPTAAGDPEQADGPAWFEDVTDAVGLNFVHDCGPTGSYFMPQAMGSGGAFIRDNDGTLYVYLVQNAGPDSNSINRLYRREKDGMFTDVTEGSGLGVKGYGMGVAVGDVNNDGKPDVLLTEYGRVRLFLNLGGGKFEDVTKDSGLDNPLWATSAAFFDYDRDGWLDLVVVNYKDYDPKVECYSPRGDKNFCTPPHFPDVPSKLFHNVTKPGCRPCFEDVSLVSNIGKLPGPGLGVVCADFNGDGWPDIFVADDGEPNRLWINQKDGTFKDEAVSRGLAYTAMGKAFAGMGVAVGDTSGSGRLDLFVTHLTSETDTLWKQESAGFFRDRSVESGLTASRWRGTGFGALMADFNLDGALDVAVVNGRVLRGGPAKEPRLGFWETYAEQNQLFANDGAGKFRDISPANKAYCGYWNVGRGLACADFDGDGAPDLLVTAIGDRARLFHNIAPDRGHWLKVRAVDPQHGGRDAYGAEVRVRAGGKEQLRVVNPAESYLCSSSPDAIFGLGKTDKVDSIKVKWPDGAEQEFDGGPADRAVELREREHHP